MKPPFFSFAATHTLRAGAPPGGLVRGLGWVFLVQLALVGCAAGPDASGRHARVATHPVVVGDSESTSSSAPAGMADSALEPAARAAAASSAWAESERLYRELARRQPRNADAKRGVGVALLRQGKNLAANDALSESLALEDHADTRLFLAESFMDMRRAPSALPHLRRAVAMDHEGVAAWVRLARALIEVDKPEAAADALLESARVCRACPAAEPWQRESGEVAKALTERAQKQRATGDKGGATRSLDAAITLRPALPDAHLERAQLARSTGDDERATAELRKAVDTAPDARGEPGGTARLELARSLTSRGEGDEATRLAREVLLARGESVTNLDVLGRACEANNDPDCARKAYGQIVRLHPRRDREKDEPNEAQKQLALDHARARLKALRPGRRRGR